MPRKKKVVDNNSPESIAAQQIAIEKAKLELEKEKLELEKEKLDKIEAPKAEAEARKTKASATVMVVPILVGAIVTLSSIFVPLAVNTGLIKLKSTPTTNILSVQSEAISNISDPNFSIRSILTQSGNHAFIMKEIKLPIKTNTNKTVTNTVKKPVVKKGR